MNRSPVRVRLSALRGERYDEKLCLSFLYAADCIKNCEKSINVMVLLRKDCIFVG